MVKRILAGICNPELTAAVAAYVVDIAKAVDAEVTALAVTDIQHLRAVRPEPMGAKSLVREIVQEKVELNEAAIKASSRLLLDQLQQAGIKHHLERPGGDPIDAMVNASRYHDLTVTGLRGLLDHGVTSEPRDALVRLIDAGVHPILAVDAAVRPIRRALIAYSGSPESARTMRQFANLNLWPEAYIKLVHFGGSEEHGRLLLTEARSYLERAGYEVETERIDGSPVKGVLGVAQDWRADLLVIGNSAKSMLRRRVLGDTAIDTLRNANLPLFLSQ